MKDNLWCEGLDFEDWEEKYEDDDNIMDYLHGNCHLWVENNYQEGDKCVAILEEREGFDTMCLMHACLLRDSKFVDVRGATSDFNAILEAFDWGDYEVVECDSLEQFKGILNGINVEYEEASKDIEK